MLVHPIEKEVTPMTDESELSEKQFELDYKGNKLTVYWDGFCLTLSHESKYVFVASVNDPEVSQVGNVSVIFGTTEEIATRLDVKQIDHNSVA